ncbi:sulfotransferase family protein [Nonlabens dokdonensis]|uniref:Sulfotransferase containing TPR domain n=2 Tax=Nonlabens dokdonensis TaxID=328515 RepID=L7WBX4_NONDD|nr:sulfotransferase [Nonlabens dokdonensis]AGC77401.1 sulfotransferase containing TPR domain [Nonlabens dokdonensis DSW-6]PZX40927.1 sulfotransferase family protein [Nonlabens dokdonensis]
MVLKFFIGGLPRSGTTMVQNILDSHPNIYGGSEFDRIPNIIDLRKKLLATLGFGRITEYTSKDQIDKAIKNLILDLFNGIESEKDIQIISEKTPWNILFFEELYELFPDAKFVMVLRNPLHVLNSMKQVAINAKANGVQPPDFTTNYLVAVAYMEQVYRLMTRLLKNHPNSFYLIKYENLLVDLKKESVFLCDFLNISWNPKLLEFNSISHPGEKTMTKDGIWYTKDKFKEDPKLKKTKNSSSNLTYLEESFVKYIFGNNQLVKGYLKKNSLAGRLISKIIYQKYKMYYRFKSIPKRLLD